MITEAPPIPVEAPEAEAPKTVTRRETELLAAEAPRHVRLGNAVLPLATTAAGVALWVWGVTGLHPGQIGIWGLLASANAPFIAGLVLIAGSFFLELRRAHPRAWVLGLGLVALITAIHASVPLVYRTPEYAWVYKHLGVIASLGHAGRVTDPNNIYQEWPVLFAAVAAISSLAHVSATSIALWSPLAFELADALLLFAVLRLLSRDRRVAWLAVFLYEGLISWVGQDYLSPQAFGFLLWLALAFVLLRWLRAPVRPARRRLAQWRTPLLMWLDEPPATSRRQRTFAAVVACVIYLAIVAAHQLTPYVVLIEVGALTVLGLIRPRWLVLALAAIAGGYLIPRYHMISSNFGGLFSGGNPLQNASGTRGTYHAGAEATTAQVVRTLAAAMWLAVLVAIVRERRTLGRIVIPATLAFAPFVVLGVQSYGGEAIYRVYLFSAPWCALLIAQLLLQLRLPTRLPLRWPVTALVCLGVLFAGLQGLWGPVAVDSFTPAELQASQWLYSHIPQGSVIVFPVDDFPSLQTADASDYQVAIMPADPQLGASWMNEGNLREVENWITQLGSSTAYIVVSHSMSESADYYGAPLGYDRLVHTIPTALQGSVVYRNADTVIYELNNVD
jgi:hypothetical protein